MVLVLRKSVWSIALLLVIHLQNCIADSYDYNDDYTDYYTEERDGHGGGGGSSGAGLLAAGTVIAPLAALIAPLAALALLGTATFMAVNPTLIQIAVIGRRRRRRRRSLDSTSRQQLDDLHTLEKFMAKVPDSSDRPAELMADYVDCSGLAAKTECLEHLTCLYSNEGTVPKEQEDVLAVILWNLLGNKYIGEDVKQRLRVAARQSKAGGSHWCSVYKCPLVQESQSHHQMHHANSTSYN